MRLVSGANSDLKHLLSQRVKEYSIVAICSREYAARTNAARWLGMGAATESPARSVQVSPLGSVLSLSRSTLLDSVERFSAASSRLIWVSKFLVSKNLREFGSVQ